MKKLKVLVTTFCLACSAIVLTSCTGIHLDGTPNLEDTVYGNGGTSVTKGDYVYYVNSYVSYSNVGKGDNNNGEVETGAIYRTKLDSNGNVVYDSNGEIENYDIVVSKVAGYEFTNLYIFDDYIYYATPNMDYAKDGTLNTSAVDFCRTTLDGSSSDVIYTANDYDDSSSYSVNKIGSSVYLVVFEKDKLVRVEINKNRIKGSETLVENVTSVLMPEIQTYTYSENNPTVGNQGYVYYTRSFSKEQDKAYDTDFLSGNVLGQIGIADKKINERKSATDKYELKALTTDYLFVTKDVDIYAIDKTFPLSENSKEAPDVRLSYSTDSLNISNFYALKNDSGYICCKNGETVYHSKVKGGKVYTIADSELTIVADDGEFAYYLDSTSIYRVRLIPEYTNNNQFELLSTNAVLGGKTYAKGDKIPVSTVISEEEYNNLTSAVDKKQFALNKNKELILSDENIDSNYIDYSNITNKEIYFFSKYTGDNDESSQVYLKRVVVKAENKITTTDEDTKEVVEPTTWDDYNKGYNAELMCKLNDEHKATTTSEEESD
jgi:hypothetical protein